MSQGKQHMIIKKRKVIYLHIGAHKTGSTILQHFLHENREILLNDGILYPVIQMKNFADFQHVGLVSMLLKNELDAFYSYIEQNDSDKDLLISSECFLLRDRNGRSLSEKLARLKDYAEKIVVIVYIRRQDTWLESLYQEEVKANQRTTLRFNNWIEKCLAEELYYRPDWLKITGEWDSIFGDNCVIVRKCENASYTGGNIFHDFMSVLGINDISAYKTPNTSRANIGFKNREFVEILRIANLFHERSSGNSQYINLLSFMNNRNEKDYSFFSPEERTNLLASFEESNSRIAQVYFNEKILFPFPSDENLSAWKPFSGINKDRLAGILLKIIHDQDKRIRNLEFLYNNLPNTCRNMQKTAPLIGLFCRIKFAMAKDLLKLDTASLIKNHLVSWEKDNSHEPEADPEGLLIEAFSSDPQIVMNFPAEYIRKNTLVRISWISDIKTELQVFWQTLSDQTFSPRQVITFRAKCGKNGCCFPVPEKFNGILRIDPGKKAGNYIIEKIQFRCLSRKHT